MYTESTLDLSTDIIDVRDVIERYEALESLKDGLVAAHLEEHPADVGMDADRFARSCVDFGEGLQDELETLNTLLAELAGNGGGHQWKGDWYPLTLIYDGHFVDAMMELCEDIGDVPRGLLTYLVVDWQATADNLRADYTSVEIGGFTYWYR